MVPFDTEDLNGVVYVWCGSKANHEDASLAEQIAYAMYKVCHHLQQALSGSYYLSRALV
ncbi:hypothetical protein DPMN_035125 [Dreissena polymorpha]|uniref:Gelsolin n=1 Tax=Dreissena polymorpha TaxID=45954 RepID=A0A9D4M6Y2_DREPO|nr:hypothetical protein DPMN_035125 [Dreissena polymorpha]